MTVKRQMAVVATVIGLVAVLVSGGRFFLSDELAPVGLGAKAPGFVAMTLDSVPAKKTLADYKGEVVLINIWGDMVRALPSRDAEH